MIRFLRWLFGIKPPGGYRCDGCGEWTSRGEGKAFVECRNPGVYLFCPNCAELKEYAKRQTKERIVVETDGRGGSELDRLRSRTT